MRVGQAFFKFGDSAEAAAENESMRLTKDHRVWLTPANEAESNGMHFMLFEEPIVLGVAAPCVHTILNIKTGQRTWMPVLYEFTGAPIRHLYEPAPRCLELLFEVTRDLYSGILSDPENASRRRDCYLDYADVAGSLAPSDFRRQHWYIAIKWNAWERANLSWPERAADLASCGMSFNPSDALKNVDALEKQCRRLKLKKGTY